VSIPVTSEISAILFDYGGVLAEEGFREGLMAIGRAVGLDPQEFFHHAAAAVYDSGYVVGKATEHDFWNLVRQRTGIRAAEEEMRSEIFHRFTLRPWMMDLARTLRGLGYQVCILSDQTQWLDDLNVRDDFFKDFDRVFNSYYLGKGKNDPTVFAEVAAMLGVEPSRILFIDDNPGHINRAESKGLHTILYQDREAFLHDIEEMNLLSSTPVTRRG
jgi:putative hydrolase of the HAD superfamily